MLRVPRRTAVSMVMVLPTVVMSIGQAHDIACGGSGDGGGIPIRWRIPDAVGIDIPVTAGGLGVVGEGERCGDDDGTGDGVAEWRGLGFHGWFWI